GEADRVIVLRTKQHGLVRAGAKGVRRAKSRFGSRLQLFVNLDVQLYSGRNLATITQADTIDYFGAQLIDDYDKYTAACVMLEAAERLSLDDDPFLYELSSTRLKTCKIRSAPCWCSILSCCWRWNMPVGHQVFLTVPNAARRDRTTLFIRLSVGHPAVIAAHRVLPK